MQNAALAGRLLRRHAPDIAFACLLLFAIFAMAMYTSLSDAVMGSALMEGSSINGIDVSGMDPDQAVDYVVRMEEERLLGEVYLVLAAQGEEASYDADDLGARTNARAVVSELIGETDKGGLMARADAYFALRKGVKCQIEVSFSSEQVSAICREFADRFYREPLDASMRLTDAGDAFAYVPDQNGAKVDRIELYHTVMERLSAQRSVRVQVDVMSVAADTPLQALTDNTMMLSVYETDVAPEEEESIARLAALLNGYALQGSESLSLRSLLYPEGIVPEEEEKMASQIAGTLYDALLLAGADKVERHPNDRPPIYMEIGLDAALDSGRDLVMRNSTRFPMYILSGVKEGVLSIEVHGRLMRMDETIRLRTGSIRLIEPDPPIFIDDRTMAAGEQKLVTEAESGYRVSAYREVVREGNVVSNELLSMDVYPPVSEVYHRGAS